MKDGNRSCQDADFFPGMIYIWVIKDIEGLGRLRKKAFLKQEVLVYFYPLTYWFEDILFNTNICLNLPPPPPLHIN